MAQKVKLLRRFCLLAASADGEQQLAVAGIGPDAGGDDQLRRVHMHAQRLHGREDPLVMVDELLPIVRRVHFKDFYVRGAEEALAIGTEDASGNQLTMEGTIASSGWLTSRYGDYLRGAIVGQGDVPVQMIVDKILEHGYDGYLSIEFEGMEDCILGSKLGFRTLNNLVG